MNNEIIRLSKISKKFVGVNEKDIIVLKSVNLKINKGELVSLTGPSGSGKTTLLMVLAGFTRPDYGSVKFGEEEVILKPPHLITEKEFHATVDINLKSAFACIRAAGKLMQKSSVLLMSSTAVSIGLGNHEMIVAAKAGIESMVRSASKTYARKELRFNAIAPSLTNTPLSKNIVNNPISLKASEKMHPVGRIGVPKDISNAIKFLIDPKNNWITGQTLSVDGGMSSTK